jgi:carboxylesterase
MSTDTSPFAHDAGSTGVLFCHGFTGSPASMRPWAEHFAQQGCTVRLPLLPGHGTSHTHMRGMTWQDWYATERDALHELQSTCDRVFVFGLSMGGTLTLRLAQEFGDAISGIVLVNASVHTEDPRAPYARWLQYVMPTIPAIGNDIKKSGADERAYGRVPVKSVLQLQQLWSVVRSDIDRVTQPTLLFMSSEDHVVEQSNAAWLAKHIPASDKSSIVLANSYHVATLDNDAELIFDKSLEFVRRLGG